MTLRNSILKLLMVITVALTFVGCNRKAIYSHYNPTPIDEWDKNDTISFCVMPIPQDGKYREVLGLRINSTYPFTRLSLIVQQQTTVSHLKRNDTVSFHLMDYDGTIHGNGISCYQYESFLTDLDLVSGDTLFVKVRHNMKREMLPGVSDVGFTVSKLNGG